MKHDIQFDSRGLGTQLSCIWLTDLHLDAVDEKRRIRFYEEIASVRADVLLIGGDIANGRAALEFLAKFREMFSLPIYFVLGNHDYYGSSISKMRNSIKMIFGNDDRVFYLTENDPVPLTDQTVLVGHDGWSDGRAGNFSTSSVRLNDYLYIDDLKEKSWDELGEALVQLGLNAAETLRPKLIKALESFKQVVILTHVPPFEEACLYEEKQTDANWAPHFVCRSVGDMLREVLSDFSEREVVVLCGHSHHRADCRILPNLRVFTGHSELGSPGIQGVLTLV